MVVGPARISQPMLVAPAAIFVVVVVVVVVVIIVVVIVVVVAAVVIPVAGVVAAAVAVLQPLNKPGDPSGRGEGFAFLPKSSIREQCVLAVHEAMIVRLPLVR